MGFTGERAEGHRAGAEAFDDGGGGFDVVEGQGPRGRGVQGPRIGSLLPVTVLSALAPRPLGPLAPLFPGEAQQPPQRAPLPRVIVAQLGVGVVGLLIVAAGGGLEVGDGGGAEGVGLALGPPVVLAGVGQPAGAAGDADAGPPRVRHLVPPAVLVGDHVEPDALQARRRAGERAVDHLVAEAQRLEDLGPLIGHQRGDAHLRHHLAEALAERVDIGLDDLGLGHGRVEAGIFAERVEGLVGEVGVDRVGAVAEEGAEVVGLAGLAGLEDEAELGAALGADKVVVDGAHGQQRADRHAAGPDAAVAQDDELVTRLDGGRGLFTKAIKRGTEGVALGVQGSGFGVRITIRRRGIGRGSTDRSEP